MTFFEEFGLLVAIGVPVVAHLGLWLGEERGTLLFPSLRPVGVGLVRS